ncbi:hypothetical protein [Neobacillus sp. OS1-33]|uniref:hypothetical protein n=1 Tax=Neobacillus sp. OS1-33 TaxID=3070683 RepID=UPI0027E04113|nr:hypothetical protein [Neobacillus sp. OS1-33]WML26316.1 hypothetical protein RCG22_01320 [Neobacillus sp. OS1-33]
MKIEQDNFEAWDQVERKIIRHAKDRLKTEIRGMSEKRSQELIQIMSNATTEILQNEFGLLSTLGRALVSWTTLCDSQAEALNKRINSNIEKRLENSRFYSRLLKDAESTLKDELKKLEIDLEDFYKEINKSTELHTELEFKPGAPKQDYNSVLNETLAPIIKGIVSTILQQITKETSEKVAGDTGKQITQKVIEKAAGEAVKETGKAGTASLLGKVAGVVTLILIPFDINKIISDFSKGKDGLIQSIESVYKMDQPLYEQRIYDDIWFQADSVIQNIIDNAKQTLNGRISDWEEWYERSKKCQESLEDLNTMIENI